jgi:HSP20 family protein
MAVSQLLPWKRTHSLPIRRSADFNEARDPFFALYREMNRLFEEVWNDFGFAAEQERDAAPSVDLVETDDAFRLTAELPGVDEKDIEILLEDDALILRGEKKSEYQDRARRLSERYYGRFERRIPLPAAIDEDKAGASFKNGVLTVVMPKLRPARQAARRIPLKAA